MATRTEVTTSTISYNTDDHLSDAKITSKIPGNQEPWEDSNNSSPDFSTDNYVSNTNSDFSYNNNPSSSYSSDDTTSTYPQSSYSSSDVTSTYTDSSNTSTEENAEQPHYDRNTITWLWQLSVDPSDWTNASLYDYADKELDVAYAWNHAWHFNREIVEKYVDSREFTDEQIINHCSATVASGNAILRSNYSESESYYNGYGWPGNLYDPTMQGYLHTPIDENGNILEPDHFKRMTFKNACVPTTSDILGIEVAFNEDKGYPMITRLIYLEDSTLVVYENGHCEIAE